MNTVGNILMTRYIASYIDTQSCGLCQIFIFQRVIYYFQISKKHIKKPLTDSTQYVIYSLVICHDTKNKLHVSIGCKN